MPSLLSSLQALLPDVHFVADKSFYWSPENQTIAYAPEALKSTDGSWSLLHEAAHSLLDHRTFQTDFELLLLEVAAWKKAKELGASHGVEISDEHIQDCLDTYRDWLHRRSTCPTCGSVSLQRSSREYACHNCPSVWTVTSERFCRPYRLKQLKRLPEVEASSAHPTFQ